MVELSTSKIEGGGLRSYFQAKAGEEARKVREGLCARELEFWCLD